MHASSTRSSENSHRNVSPCVRVAMDGSMSAVANHASAWPVVTQKNFRRSFLRNKQLELLPRRQPLLPQKLSGKWWKKLSLPPLPTKPVYSSAGFTSKRRKKESCVWWRATDIVSL